MAGTVFVDRGDRAQAILAMQPAIEATRRGFSILVAPEGTRSGSKKLGRFKKGAFHMAMAAGVPIVPIVLRNASDALPRDGIMIHPATVEVVVHPPIPTHDWMREDLDARIAEIQRLFEETLA
jgi:putative phosphoserine phosphatase/1-acylglycerol-3-phosphate O-acyltransferase